MHCLLNLQNYQLREQKGDIKVRSFHETFHAAVILHVMLESF